MEKTNFNSNIDLYKRIMVRVALGLFYSILLIFIMPKVISVAFPFFVALVLAVALDPFVSKINSKFRISRKCTALFLNLLIAFSVSFFIYILLSLIFKEIVGLSLNIQHNWQAILIKMDTFQESFNWLVNILPPQVLDFFLGFKESVLVFIQTASKNMLTNTVSMTTNITSKAGNFSVSFLTFFISLYFFVSDYNHITHIAQKHFSKRFIESFVMLKSSVVRAFGGYLKAQLLLALLAFIYMLITLGMYGQQHVILISLLIGIVDFLPIVGAIAVLVPWAIFEIVVGEINKGFFLLLIGGSFFLIRRTLEPKIMGSQTGLHPLMALISTYVGLKIAGVLGAILGPILLMLLASVLKSGIFNNTISDFKELLARISMMLSNNKN